VAAVSASDIWAVGLNPSGSLIMHWNGTRWTRSSEPGFLEGTAATSPDNAWAVGGSNWFDPNATVIYHWNGSDWTRQPSPNPPSGGSLNSVAAMSASNAWAVGQTGPGPGEGTSLSDRTLIQHWDGTAWTRVPSPTPAPAGGLTRVSVISASDAWAVGTSIAGPALQGVILHWNGTTWKRAATPAHQPDGYLLGVTASSASNIWAVGQTNSRNCSSRCNTIIEHWNGCMWTMVPSPNPPSSYLNSLWGIVAVSRDNAWAVGTTDYSNTLIVHWNGTSWS
jgi:hypothetical protein